MDQLGIEEEEVIYLQVCFGFIDKAQLRRKAFKDSKYYYLRTVELLCQADPDFAKEYSFYKLKKNMPKNIVYRILKHIDFEVIFTRY